MRQSSVRVLLALALTTIVMAVNGVPALSETYRTQLDAPYLASPSAFAFELVGKEADKSDAVWIDEWFFHQTPPANARMLAKLPIYLSYRAACRLRVAPLTAFYASYRCWTAIFLCAFLLLGARCCATAARDIAPATHASWRSTEMLAMCALAALPPVLFGCKFPIHGSPNDLLGYALLAASMQALFTRNLARYLLFALCAIVCRETNLITLIPLLILGPGGARARGSAALAIVALSLVFRAVVGGAYDPFVGARYNWEFPWESASFLYLTFGPLWLTAMFYGLCLMRGPQQAATRRFLWCAALSVPLVLVVVLGVARAREIRIPFVLYIYVIPLAVLGIQRFFDNFTRARRALLLSAVLLGMALTFRLYVTLMPLDFAAHARRAHAFASLYGGFGGGWQFEFLAYFLLALPALAIGLSLMRMEASTGAYP